ncbi:hypothetical protein DFJ74DRAFT_747031 [Hyaloraphidium curvatum]|nr:hypothetical protein DFJ74DRAFT_747031 [Hyaloraphidium curvatum]
MAPRRSKRGLAHAVGAASDLPGAMPVAVPDTSAVTRPIPRLPPELWSLIFSFVFDDVKAAWLWNALLPLSTLSCEIRGAAMPVILPRRAWLIGNRIRLFRPIMANLDLLNLITGIWLGGPGGIRPKDLCDVLSAPFGPLHLEMRLFGTMSAQVRPAFAGAEYVKKLSVDWSYAESGAELAEVGFPLATEEMFLHFGSHSLRFRVPDYILPAIDACHNLRALDLWLSTRADAEPLLSRMAESFPNVVGVVRELQVNIAQVPAAFATHPRLNMQKLSLFSDADEWSPAIVPSWWERFCEAEGAMKELELGSMIGSLVGSGVPRVETLRLQNARLRFPLDVLPTAEQQVRSRVGTLYLRNGY